MSNLHRIQWIDSQIRKEKYPNCSDIAKKFEITSRQASRDIEYLRYSLNAPIEYIASQNGYTYTGNEYILPREHLTEKDTILLRDLAESYSSIGTERATKIALLFSRIYDNDTLEKTENSEKYLTKVRTILETCLKENKDATITYIDAGNTKTERCIRPIRIFQWGSNELVEAWCHTRNASRQFRLDRIRSAVICNRHPAQLTQQQQTKLNQKTIEIGDGSQSKYGKLPYVACVHIGKYQKETIYCNFYKSSELLAWLFQNYLLFKIASPNWLKSKIATHLSQLAKIHN